MHIRLLALFLLAFGLQSCSMISKDSSRPEAGLIDKYKQIVGNATLTDADIEAYCRTYKQLRAMGPSVLQDITNNPQGGQQDFTKMESAMKAGGFRDYAHFVVTNAKVAWAWNIYQATGFATDINQQKDQALVQLQANLDDFQAKLDDPNFPEEGKVEIRKAIVETQNAMKEIQETFARNNPWANLVLDRLRPLTNDADMAMVRRHKDELMEAFTGYPPNFFDADMGVQR